MANRCWLGLLLALAAVVSADPVLWAGGVTSTTAQFRALASAATKLLVSTSIDLSAPIDGGVALAAGMNAKSVTTLTPNTRYYYAMENQIQVVGSFWTPKPEGTATNFTFGFGACIITNTTHEIFDTVAKKQYDLFVFMGDLHYRDIQTNEPDKYREAYVGVFDRSVGKMLRNSTIAYMFDDHDFGANDATSDSPSAPAAKSVYREYYPHPPLPHETAAYHAFTVGRVRFIMTDTQSFQTKTQLVGQTQMTWIQNELAQWRQYSLVVIMFTKPWNIIQSQTCCGWHYSPKERTQLANYIKSQGITNLIGLAGDQHMLAFDSGNNTDYATGGGAGFPIFQSAGMDQKGSYKGGGFDGGGMKPACVGRPPFTAQDVCNFTSLSFPEKYRVNHWSEMAVVENPDNTTCINYKAYSYQYNGATAPALTWSKCGPFVMKGNPEGLVDGDILTWQCPQHFADDIAIGSCIANTAVIVFMGVFLIGVVTVFACIHDNRLRDKGTPQEWACHTPGVLDWLAGDCQRKHFPTLCCECSLCNPVQTQSKK